MPHKYYEAVCPNCSLQIREKYIDRLGYLIGIHMIFCQRQKK
ncbi:MAG: hypothetical protein QXQ33_00630 [Nitrososphaerota archaeon]